MLYHAPVRNLKFAFHAASTFATERSRRRCNDSSEPIIVLVIKSIACAINALIIKILLLKRETGLKAISKAMLVFGFEVRAVICPFALALVQSDKLINLPAVRWQRFGTAGEAEELLVGVNRRNWQQNECHHRDLYLHC
jgi:hypothetical protein